MWGTSFVAWTPIWGKCSQIPISGFWDLALIEQKGRIGRDVDGSRFLHLDLQEEEKEEAFDEGVEQARRFNLKQIIHQWYNSHF